MKKWLSRLFKKQSDTYCRLCKGPVDREGDVWCFRCLARGVPPSIYEEVRAAYLKETSRYYEPLAPPGCYLAAGIIFCCKCEAVVEIDHGVVIHKCHE